MRIDTTKIENYETMSAEEKLKALEEFDMDMSGFVSKEQFDRASSTIAEYKRKEKASMGEAERLKAEQTEAMAKMEEELNALRTEKQLSDFKAKCISLGYDEKSAEESANAYVNGDWQKVFQLQKANIEKNSEKIKADLLAGTPKPEGGNGGGGEPKQMPKFF